MILDSIGNALRYHALGEGFRKAFEFLSSVDLAALPVGKSAVDGDRIFAIVSRGAGRNRGEGQLEVHRRCADVQYVVAGVEEMGFRPGPSCVRPAGPFDAEKDIGFFADEPQIWLTVAPGSFALFFPGEAHLPMVAQGEIRKVVVKVGIDEAV